MAKSSNPNSSDPEPPHKRSVLPPELQSVLDDEEKLWVAMQEGRTHEITSTDTPIRYAAYASRVRTILSASHRYLAYTSDIGESFRPIAHPYLVRSTYAISWAYLIGDVSYEGYKAWVSNQKILNPDRYQDLHVGEVGSTGITTPVLEPGPVQLELEKAKHAIEDSASSGGWGRFLFWQGSPEKEATPIPEVPIAPAILEPPLPIATPTIHPLEDYRTVMVQRAVFQSLASMGLPAFTIHSLVRYSGQAFKSATWIKNTKVKTWTPIGLGLGAIPFLPYIFDEPVEQAVEWAFARGSVALGYGLPPGGWGSHGGGAGHGTTGVGSASGSATPSTSLPSSANRMAASNSKFNLLTASSSNPLASTGIFSFSSRSPIVTSYKDGMSNTYRVPFSNDILSRLFGGYQPAGARMKME